MDTPSFWEARAQRFAGDGAGLRAICSYAMPSFYNWAIDLTQRRALNCVIRSIAPGSKVLDYGCGIGRWSRGIADRGAAVTGIDFSPTMIAEARRRTSGIAFSGECAFKQADVTELASAEQYDVAIGVTVLQHVLEDGRLGQTIDRLARCLRPHGRLILFEVAPSRIDMRCDTQTFRARTLDTYLSHIEAAGLQVRAIRGVDPAPFKLWVLPRFRRWPRPLALFALGIASLISLPVDLIFAQPLKRMSWHKIIIAERRGAPK